MGFLCVICLNPHNPISLIYYFTSYVWGNQRQGKQFGEVKLLVCENLGLKPRSLWFQNAWLKQLQYIAQCKLYPTYSINCKKHNFLPL